jgi:hypothetical protein
VEEGVSTVAKADTMSSEFCEPQLLYKSCYHLNTHKLRNDMTDMTAFICGAVDSDIQESKFDMNLRRLRNSSTRDRGGD